MAGTRRCTLVVLLILSCIALLIIVLNGPGEEELLDRQRPGPLLPPRADELASLEPGRSRLGGDLARILNLTDFRLVIDAKCNYSIEETEDWELDRGGGVAAVWIITSYAAHAEKRSALRRAYSNAELAELGVRRIFLLGLLDEQAQINTGVTQAALENEAQRFQDIIQGSFIEAYKNLTYKHLMGLQWAAERCTDSYNYIIKMDDDIVINLYEAMELIKNKTSTNVNDNFLMGYVMDRMTPVRNRESKWFVTEEEYPKAVYPPFLSGWFYVTDILTALKLVYQSKKHSNYFWIDDLFVTGILRNEAGIHDFINVKDVFTTDYRFLKCCLKHQNSQPKYKCDFIVGPDGADSSLLLTFKKYCEYCYLKNNCRYRPKDELLKDKCILDYRNLNTNLGSAQVEKLNPVSNIIN